MNIDLSVQEIEKRFAGFTAVDRVSFDVQKGSFFSILGPSGCGKTTLLRMIAGFLAPDSGVIEINGKNMDGVPPNKRPVNLIFQHLALFPMMNVAENIAFGLKRRREKKKEINRKVSAILERVGLPGFGEKKIESLSGGQKQRVAIARCLVLEPSVLLLDEPLGALDLKLREQMKVELKKLQAQVGTTFVYITHDQSEALVMSDLVAVMNKGRFEQIDSPQNLYHKPKTPFVARFVGESNTWSGSILECSGDTVKITTGDGFTFVHKTKEKMEEGEQASFFLRPEAMLIQPDQGNSGLNLMDVKVKAILFDGANSRLLAIPIKGEKEFLIALPQNRQYDHLRVNDSVTIGWDFGSGVLFKGNE